MLKRIGTSRLLRHSISGLVVEYIVAIDVTRVRFPADALIIGHGILGRPSAMRRPSVFLEPQC